MSDYTHVPPRPVYQAPLCSYCDTDLDLYPEHLKCPACRYSFCLSMPPDGCSPEHVDADRGTTEAQP